MKILAMKGKDTFIVRLNENESALVNLTEESVLFDEKGAYFLRSGMFYAPVYDEDMEKKMFALITAQHDENELREILIRFATCGIQPLAEVSANYLQEKAGKEALIPVLEDAAKDDSIRAYKYEEKFRRALELLRQ